jgi:hypothetical protein
MKDKRISQPLFRSIGSDGTDWLFIVGCDSGWAITRNGQAVGLGAGDRSSIIRGVDKFTSLSRSAVNSELARDLSISELAQCAG